MTKHNEEHLFLILLNKQSNPLNTRLKLLPWWMLSSCFYKRIAIPHVRIFIVYRMGVNKMLQNNFCGIFL